MLLCLLGLPGMGKSSFGAQWPGARFVIDPRDEGIIDLIYEGVVPTKMEHVLQCTDYSGLKSNLYACLNDPACKSIIVESVVGIQDLCFEAHSRKDYGGDIGEKFNKFGNGPREADLAYFKGLVDIMQQCQRKGKHVVLMGHVAAKNVKNVAGDDWLMSVINCDKNISSRIDKTFQNIFQMVEAVQTVGKVIGVKAQSDSSRWLYVQQNTHYFAKNRMGLVAPFQIPPNAKDFFNVFCQHTKRNPKTCYRL